MVIEGWVGEGGDGLWDVVAAGFDRDIVVVGKVDTSMSLGRIIWNAKEFSFDFGICGARNMLTVSPLSIS